MLKYIAQLLLRIELWFSELGTQLAEYNKRRRGRD
jgi:hypothetical protein